MTYTEKALQAVAQGDKAEADMLETLLASAVQRGIKESKRAEQAQALHNAALLMDNYRTLKGYPARAIADADQARATGCEIQGEAWLRSIRKNKARTAVMLAHVDAALEELQQEATRRGCAYMFDAYKMHYVDGCTLDEVGQKYNAGKNTPGRWCKKMNERLAVLLFGLDGLRRW